MMNSNVCRSSRGLNIIALYVQLPKVCILVCIYGSIVESFHIKTQSIYRNNTQVTGWVILRDLLDADLYKQASIKVKIKAGSPSQLELVQPSTQMSSNVEVIKLGCLICGKLRVTSAASLYTGIVGIIAGKII